MISNAPPAGLDALAEQTRGISQALAVTTDSGELIRLAGELNNIEERSDALWQAHCESMLSELSSNARRSLDEYLHRAIAPGMTYVRTDYVGLYSEAAQLLPQIRMLERAGLARVPVPDNSAAEASTDATGFVGHSNTD